MLPPCIQGGAEFHLPADSGGATPMEPKKGCSGMVDAGGEGGDHPGAVERDDFGAAVGEVVGEEAAAGAEAVAGEVGVELDFEDADFEDVAGLGFGDGDGAGEDVAAGAAVGCGDLFVDAAEPIGDLGGGDAFALEAFGWAAGGGGLHDDGVAGVHGERGLGVRGIVAPGDGGGRGEEGLGGLRGEGRRKQSTAKGEQAVATHSFL